MDYRGDSRRNVVPRWRWVRQTIAFGEAAALPVERPKILAADMDLEEAQYLFEETGGMPYAAELIMGASLLGDRELARKAAKAILSKENGSDLLRSIATNYVAAGGGVAGNVDDLDRASAIQQFRGRREFVARSALDWLDLGYAYALAGDYRKAERAVRVALGLRGNNRTVLRSAIRFYQHIREFDRCLFVLRQRTAQVLVDPWLLSAEIGLMQLVEGKVRHLKEARRFMASGDLAPFHLAELAAAMGTVEMQGGRHLKAKKLFRLAMREPTDVSFAQVAWVHSRDKTVPVNAHKVRQFMAEGQTRMAFTRGEWKKAGKAGLDWLAVEPFSGMAASFVCALHMTILKNYEVATRVAENGFRLNPTNVTLAINLAFAYGSTDRLDEAQAMLNQIPPEDLKRWPEAMICAVATQGLVLLRRRQVDSGRQCYEAAMRASRARQWPKLEARAAVFLAREMREVTSLGAEEYDRKARALVKRTRDPELEEIVRAQLDHRSLFEWWGERRSESDGELRFKVRAPVTDDRRILKLVNE